MTEPKSAVRQFIASSSAMAVLYAGSTVLTFGVGLLLARMLGVSGYGVYALAMTTATMAGLVTEFGLPLLAMREVGIAQADNHWSAVRGLLRWAEGAILVLSLALLIGTYAVFGFLSEGRSSAYLETLLWAALLVPFVAIGKLRSYVLLGLGMVYSSQSTVMILRPALFIAGCVAVWLVAGQLEPQSAMAVQTCGAALAMLVSLWQFRRYAPPALIAAKPIYAVREWMHVCLPLGLTEGLRLLQGQLGLILTGVFAGTAQAGLYRVADAVAGMTAVVASVIGTAATPMFARLWRAGDRDGLERVAMLGAWGMAGGIFALGLPILLGSGLLFPALFGSEFAGSAPVFALLWAGMVLAASFGLVLAIANMTGHHVLATQTLVVIAAINAIGASLLVPQFGALGAGGATGAGSIIGMASCAYRLRRRTGLNFTLFSRKAVRLALELPEVARTFLADKRATRG